VSWPPARPRGPLSRVVALAGRGRRLWLAGAEAALSGDCRRPVALVLRPGRLGLRGEVLLEGAPLPAADDGWVVPVLGAPGARYVHLAPVAQLLEGYGISTVGWLSWAPGKLWLGPVTPPPGNPSSAQQWTVRALSAEGRLCVDPLRAHGALPRLLHLRVHSSSRRVELRVRRHLDPGDPSVVRMRGAPTAPYVYLTGPVGRRARAILGARGRLGARVWVRAELGALIVVPLALNLGTKRPVGVTGGERGVRR